MQKNYIFSVLHSEYFSILIANKIFNVIVLLLIYICDQFVVPLKFVTADVTAVFSTINVVFSDEDNSLIKSFYLKRYKAKSF